MPELAPDDLPASVRALFADDDEAQDAIDAVLASARRYCGWHVSPVKSDEVIDMDGPGGRVLSLPTLNLLSVASVTELGVALDVTTLDKSRRKGTLTKPFGCWTSRDGAIVATVTHGYTEDEAQDWRAAIARLVGIRAREARSQRDDPQMASKKVDDVEYGWFATLISTDELLGSMFAAYRILPCP